MTTMLRISETEAEVLGPNGWEPADWVPLPGGNFVQINSEGYFSGLIHGIAAGVLTALIVLGVYAVAVS